MHSPLSTYLGGDVEDLSLNTIIEWRTVKPLNDYHQLTIWFIKLACYLFGPSGSNQRMDMLWLREIGKLRTWDPTERAVPTWCPSGIGTSGQPKGSRSTPDTRYLNARVMARNQKWAEGEWIHFRIWVCVVTYIVGQLFSKCGLENLGSSQTLSVAPRSQKTMFTVIPRLHFLFTLTLFWVYSGVILYSIEQTSK